MEPARDYRQLLKIAVNSQNLKAYNLPYGWRISFPSNWEYAYQPEPEGDQHLFYPPDSDLTFRVTSLLVKFETGYAPTSALREAFTRTIGGMKKCVSIAPAGASYTMDCYEGRVKENNRVIYRFCCGMAVEGHLLNISVFSSNHDILKQSLFPISTVCRAESASRRRQL